METMYAYREVQVGHSFQTTESGRALDKFFQSVAMGVYPVSLLFQAEILGIFRKLYLDGSG